MMTTTVPTNLEDPINAQILTISEDRISGFQTDPFTEIARQSKLPVSVVIERIEAMLRAGVIRRVRQTLLATNLAEGALIAWKIGPETMNEAFDWMFKNDPFTGHVVLRSTDAQTPGASYRLWTTLKVPQGYSFAKHCELLCKQVNAEKFLAMPAKRLFALGVGHMRRRQIKPGDKADVAGEPMIPNVVELSELEWRVLIALKQEFSADEIAAIKPADGTETQRGSLWEPRAKEAGVDLATFCNVATALNARRVIGRFSTFLEHVKPLATGERVTQYNGLFHWRVPEDRVMEAGKEVARHYIMTHCYWRDGGEDFGYVNIMGVVHGTDKELVLAHKAAIDKHLESIGIPVLYTNVFWGGRSEIKPSEISPFAYADWCRSRGIDPETMRDK